MDLTKLVDSSKYDHMYGDHKELQSKDEWKERDEEIDYLLSLDRLKEFAKLLGVKFSIFAKSTRPISKNDIVQTLLTKGLVHDLEEAVKDTDSLINEGIKIQVDSKYQGKPSIVYKVGFEKVVNRGMTEEKFIPYYRIGKIEPHPYEIEGYHDG